MIVGIYTMNKCQQSYIKPMTFRKNFDMIKMEGDNRYGKAANYKSDMRV